MKMTREEAKGLNVGDVFYRKSYTYEEHPDALYIFEKGKDYVWFSALLIPMGVRYIGIDVTHFTEGEIGDDHYTLDIPSGITGLDIMNKNMADSLRLLDKIRKVLNKNITQNSFNGL